MKHLIRYCNVCVVFGLLELMGVCEYTDMLALGRCYLVLLLAFIILKLPPVRRQGVSLMGEVYLKMMHAMSVTGVLAIWCALAWHVVVDDRYCFLLDMFERLGECFSIVFSIHFFSLLVYGPFMIPWQSLLSGEKYSDYLEFVYKAMRLFIIAYISLVGLIFILGLLLVFVDSGDVQDVLEVSAVMGLYAVLSLIPLQVLKPSVERARQRRAMRVLIHINHAVRANLPLVHVLEAARHSEQGRLSRRLADLAMEIPKGVTISEAIKTCVPEFELPQLRVLEAADRIGYLPQAIERLVEQMSYQHSNSITASEPGWRYLLFNIFGASLLISATMIFIVPKFEKIFQDFDTVLPPISMNLMQTARWFGGSLPDQQVPGVLWLLVPMSLFVAIWNSRHGEHLVSKLYQWLAWHLPLCRLVHRPAELAKVAQQLSDGLDAALPLEKIITNMRISIRHVVVNAMLRRFGHYLQQGQDIPNAARLARFPSLFVMMLGPSEHQQSLPQVMYYMAEYYQLLARHRVIWFRSLVSPIVVLLVGIPVGWICVGLFTPLVVLIEHCVVVSGVY